MATGGGLDHRDQQDGTDDDTDDEEGHDAPTSRAGRLESEHECGHEHGHARRARRGGRPTSPPRRAVPGTWPCSPHHTNASTTWCSPRRRGRPATNRYSGTASQVPDRRRPRSRRRRRPPPGHPVRRGTPGSRPFRDSRPERAPLISGCGDQGDGPTLTGSGPSSTAAGTGAAPGTRRPRSMGSVDADQDGVERGAHLGDEGGGADGPRTLEDPTHQRRPDDDAVGDLR